MLCSDEVRPVNGYESEDRKERRKGRRDLMALYSFIVQGWK
jgi:hypothetical protein